MSIEIPGRLIPLEASADLSANQHRFLVVDANGQVAVAGAGVLAVGVLQNDPAAQGEAATVMLDGVSKVVAGAAVTSGAEVASDASGRAVTAATGNRVNGIALETCANAGEVIAVALLRGGQLN